MTKPQDFWSFWDATRATLAETAPESTGEIASEHSSDIVMVRRVTIRSFEDRPIHGWYATPPLPQGARIAGLLWLPGYAEDPDVNTAAEWAEQGFATLVLAPRGQGAGKPFPEGADGKFVHEVADVHRYAYRSVFMDCLRGFDFLRSQPEVHPGNVAVAGGSQGGGLALATAALSEGRAAVVAAHVPFLCDLEWLLDHPAEAGPRGELSNYLAEHPERSDIVRRTLSYYDAVNFAERIACPVLLTAGLKDELCPHQTIEAAFEAVGTTKALLVEPEMAHEWRDDTRKYLREWIMRHLG